MKFLAASVSFTAATAALATATTDRRPKFGQIGWSTLGGGTTGGKGGEVFRVSTSEQLLTAVRGNDPKIIYVTGPIILTARPQVGNNTSIIGVGRKADITGYGLRINAASNIIIRNVIIHHAVDLDAISLTFSNNVWVDHCEFYSDRDHGVDYYDGLVDITRGSDFVTVSYNYFHTHYKSSLVGGEPATSLPSPDGRYRVTYHHNYWRDLSTRTPALRFSSAHVFNNYYQDISAQGIHTRSYGQALIEYNVFRNVTEPISTYGFVIPEDSPNSGPEGDYEPDGYANVRRNDFGGSGPSNITQIGNLTTVPYKYDHYVTKLKDVKKTVVRWSGVGKI